MPQWILGDRFETTYPHKGSIKALWETKWKFCVRLLDQLGRITSTNPNSEQASKSIYPFHDGAFEDFEPIFEKLITVSHERNQK